MFDTWEIREGGDKPNAVDSYGLLAEPSAEELLSLNTDSVAICTQYLADKCASIGYGIYIKQLPGQSQAKDGLIEVQKNKVKTRIPTCEIIKKSLRPDIIKKSVEDNARKVLDHKYLTLLNNPNPFLSFHQMIKITDSHISLVAKSYWFKRRENYKIEVKNGVQLVKQSGEVLQLEILLVQHCDIVYGNGGEIIGLKYSPAGTSQPKLFDWKDIVPFHLPDPASPYSCGWSPTRMAYERIEISKREISHLLALFKNQCRPDVAIPVNGGVTDDDLEMMNKQVNQRYTKGGEGGVFFYRSEDGFTPEPLQWKPKDVFGVDLYKWIKLQIINTWKLNPAVIDQESSNRSTIATALRLVEQEAVLPRLTLYEQSINKHLTQEFGDRLWFAFDNCVSNDDEFDLERVKEAVDRDLITLNEGRKILFPDLEPLSAHGDKTLTEFAGNNNQNIAPVAEESKGAE